MKMNDQGGTSSKDSWHQNGDDYSHPIAIPATSENNNGTEDTPLLTSPTNFLIGACRQQHQPSSNPRPWGTDEFLSCSPMVSGPRSNILRLPNLDLREARRAAAAAANARLMTSSLSEEFASKEESDRRKRSRSRSLGNEHDNETTLRDSDDSTQPLGEVLLKRRTPSGLSLMDLTGNVVDDAVWSTETNIDVEQIHNESESNIQQQQYEGYGAFSTETTTYTQPLKEAPETLAAGQLKTSQSCTIPDLNPSPRTSPRRERSRKAVDTKNSLLEDLRQEFASQSNPPILSILYALVNTSIVLPILMSFGSIIYHDDFFRPYLSVLMKLTAISGAVHQITFSTVSSLPFAVGQVQDAGLIFLSAMARDLVSRLRSMGVDDTSILATVTIGLSLYTATLGMCLIVVGRFKLASYCQLLPSSVIAGYLAYIGFFCGQAALALMASVDVTGLAEWYKFLNVEALTLLTPGVIGGCVIYFSVRTFRHMSVLPCCIVMILAAFYAVLWATNTSVKEAMDNGWINETVESPSWQHTWEYLSIEKVVWSVLPSQTLTILAMICVVALSSSLDIAAIEIELKRPLDYNHELKTVGISNVISGLTGGYTGSYIFSQTIFSLRMGIRSRLMGYILAFLTVVAVMIPVNILALIPNFFFGSLLMLICLDLMFEWLIDVRERVTSAEYVIVLGTFALLQVLGVAFGIIGGCILFVFVRQMGYDVGGDEKLNEDELAIVNYGTST